MPQVNKFLEENSKKWILLLNNAPSHRPDIKTANGSIITMYMPPTVIPLIQPMVQNVTCLTKLHYRTKLLFTMMTDSDQLVKYLIFEGSKAFCPIMTAFFVKSGDVSWNSQIFFGFFSTKVNRARK